MSTPAFRRVLRRETHSPRTVAMIIAVVLLLLALAYTAVEIALFLLGQPALLVDPGTAAQWLVDLPDLQPVGLVVTGGIVLGLIGIVLIVLAVAPGRLAKHQMHSDTRAVVVDNGVIAAALAQHVSDETGIARDSITVGVSHRTADITLRPGPGIPLAQTDVADIAATELGAYRLQPPVKPRVRIVRPKESEQDW